MRPLDYLLHASSPSLARLTRVSRTTFSGSVLALIILPSFPFARLPFSFGQD